YSETMERCRSSLVSADKLSMSITAAGTPAYCEIRGSSLVLIRSQAGGQWSWRVSCLKVTNSFEPGGAGTGCVGRRVTVRHFVSSGSSDHPGFLPSIKPE